MSCACKTMGRQVASLRGCMLVARTISQQTHAGSGDPAISELSDFAPRPHELPQQQEAVQMAITYTDGAGRTRVKGGRDLKGSQSYPPQLLGETVWL